MSLDTQPMPPTIAGRLWIDGEYYQRSTERFGFRPLRNAIGEFQITDRWCSPEDLKAEVCHESLPPPEQQADVMRYCWCKKKYSLVRPLSTCYDKQMPEIPRMPQGRTNLTVLSQAYNLYFGGFSHKLYVYRPRHFRTQIIPAKADLILFTYPTKSARRIHGYQSRERCHDINRVEVGFLGSMEVVVTVHDNGDVVVYATRYIEKYVRFLLKYGRNPVPSDGITEPKPFSHFNVGASAWGIAIHSKSRLIAITSNKFEVVVFAPAMEVPASEFRHDHPLGPRHRERDLFVYLYAGRDANNLPCVDFLEDSQGNADRVVVGSITGEIRALDIWRVNTRVSEYIEFIQHSMDETRILGECCWSIKAVPDDMFVPCRSLEEALYSERLDKMTLPTLIGRVVHMRSTVARVDPDRSRSVIPMSKSDRYHIDLSQRGSPDTAMAWRMYLRGVRNLDDGLTATNSGYESDDDFNQLSCANGGFDRLKINEVNFSPHQGITDDEFRRRLARSPPNYRVVIPNSPNIPNPELMSRLNTAHDSSRFTARSRLLHTLDIKPAAEDNPGPRLYMPHFNLEADYPDSDREIYFHNNRLPHENGGLILRDDLFYKNSKLSHLMCGFQNLVSVMQPSIKYTKQQSVLQYLPSRHNTDIYQGGNFSMCHMIPELSLVVMGNTNGQVYLLTPTKVGAEYIKAQGLFKNCDRIRYGFRLEARLPECLPRRRGLPCNKCLVGVAVSPLFEDDIAHDEPLSFEPKMKRVEVPSPDATESFEFELGVTEANILERINRRISTPKSFDSEALAGLKSILVDTKAKNVVVAASEPIGDDTNENEDFGEIPNLSSTEPAKSLSTWYDGSCPDSAMPDGILPADEDYEAMRENWTKVQEVLDPDDFVPWWARRKKRIERCGPRERKWRIMLHYEEHSIITYIIGRGGDGEVDVLIEE